MTIKCKCKSVWKRFALKAVYQSSTSQYGSGLREGGLIFWNSRGERGGTILLLLGGVQKKKNVFFALKIAFLSPNCQKISGGDNFSGWGGTVPPVLMYEHHTKTVMNKFLSGLLLGSLWVTFNQKIRLPFTNPILKNSPLVFARIAMKIEKKNWRIF